MYKVFGTYNNDMMYNVRHFTCIHDVPKLIDFRKLQFVMDNTDGAIPQMKTAIEIIFCS